MTLAATTIIEAQTGGSDTLNGGMFDPGQTAGMLTDGAATSATTNAPVFTSASYNFVSGDIGAWVYIASGTNWIAGWYQIASVASNAATLAATAGVAVLSTFVLSTATGCATTGSPTGATWAIDYSQQAAAQYAYTDLASVGTGLTVSSVAKPFNKEQVGNSIVVTGGTNFNTGRYVIASVAANVATVVGPTNITTGAGVSGTGGQGGCLASASKAISLSTIQGMIIWLKNGTYSSTAITWPSISATASLSRLVGYNTIRADGAGSNRPIMRLTATGTLLTLNSNNGISLENIDFDGNSVSTTDGVALYGYCVMVNCKVRRFTHFRAVICSGTPVALINCEISNNTCTSAGLQTSSNSTTVSNCYIHDNSCPGITAGGSGATIAINECIIYNNTGASSYGINLNGASNVSVRRCSIYSNGGDGLRLSTTNDWQNGLEISNNIIVSNGGYGMNLTTAPAVPFTYPGFFNNAFYNNTSGARNNITASTTDVTLTGVPFTNAGSGDFSLNNTANQGAACRATGFPGVLIGGGTGYIDIGALQHQATGGAATVGYGYA